MTFQGWEKQREEMDRLKDEILASRDADPEDYDGREALWMQRENLRAGLPPRRFDRFRVIGDRDLTTVGAMCIVLSAHIT